MGAMRNEGSGSSLTQWSWAGSVTLSVSRPTPNRKSRKIRLASSALLNFLPGTDGYCSMAGLAFSLSLLLLYFLILIITTHLRQSTQSRSIKSYTKQRIGQQLTTEYTSTYWWERGKSSEQHKSKS